MRALIREYRANERREDERAAYLAFHFSRAVGGKRKGGGELQMGDFLPQRRAKEQKATTVEAMVRFAELATWVWGGKDMRKQKDGRPNNAR